MLSFRNSTWLGALTVAALLAGCSSSDESNSTSPAAATTPTPGPYPATGAGPDAGEATKNSPAPAAPSEPGAPAKAAPADSAPPAVEGPKVEGPAAKSAAVQLTPAEIAEIKKLKDPADQDAAIKQAVCPISEGHLGDPDMGVPLKVTAEGKSFFICCKGCEKEAQAKAKEILAKMGK